MLPRADLHLQSIFVNFNRERLSSWLPGGESPEPEHYFVWPQGSWFSLRDLESIWICLEQYRVFLSVWLLRSKGKKWKYLCEYGWACSLIDPEVVFISGYRELCEPSLSLYTESKVPEWLYPGRIVFPVKIADLLSVAVLYWGAGRISITKFSTFLFVLNLQPTFYRPSSITTSRLPNKLGRTDFFDLWVLTEGFHITFEWTFSWTWCVLYCVIMWCNVLAEIIVAIYLYITSVSYQLAVGSVQVDTSPNTTSRLYFSFHEMFQSSNLKVWLWLSQNCPYLPALLLCLLPGTVLITDLVASCGESSPAIWTPRPVLEQRTFQIWDLLGAF